MHLSHATFHAASVRRATTALITGSLALIPTTSAYGITLDGIVDRISEQPALTFCVGCAVGAVVGGLVANQAGIRNRRALIDEIHWLEKLLQEQRYPDTSSEDETESTLDFSPEKREPAEVPAEPQKNDADVQEAKPMQQEQPERPAVPAVEPAAEEPAPVASAEPEDTPHAKESGHRVHDLLLSRLSAHPFDDVPVIDRGAERMTRAKEFEDRFATRCMDRLTRAKVIDKRVPGFDDVIFPEKVEPEQADKDDFERAMEAMESTLDLAQSQASESLADSRPYEESPAVIDAAAYVEELLNDEMERSRSSKAQSFSHSQFTVIEGTGDLSKARTRAHIPRHLSRVSREA